jgi:hypothetical protein
MRDAGREPDRFAHLRETLVSATAVDFHQTEQMEDVRGIRKGGQ